MNVLVLMDMQEKLYNEDKHSREIEETESQTLKKIRDFDGVILTTKAQKLELSGNQTLDDKVALALNERENVLYLDKDKCGKKEIGNLISIFDDVKKITVVGLYSDICRTIAVDILVVVDMQYDFLYGALRNEMAIAIEPSVAKLIEEFDGFIIVTRDTHHEDYLTTQEGRLLPVIHCIEGTPGHKITEKVQAALDKKPNVKYLNKETFGSKEIGMLIEKFTDIGIITLVGVCTDICVINNAMVIKAFNSEARVEILRDYCAGVSDESHDIALKALAGSQFFIL